MSIGLSVLYQIHYRCHVLRRMFTYFPSLFLEQGQYVPHNLPSSCPESAKLTSECATPRIACVAIISVRTCVWYQCVIVPLILLFNLYLN